MNIRSIVTLAIALMPLTSFARPATCRTEIKTEASSERANLWNSLVSASAMIKVQVNMALWTEMNAQNNKDFDRKYFGGTVGRRGCPNVGNFVSGVPRSETRTILDADGTEASCRALNTQYANFRTQYKAILATAASAKFFKTTPTLEELLEFSKKYAQTPEYKRACSGKSSDINHLANCLETSIFSGLDALIEEWKQDLVDNNEVRFTESRNCLGIF